MGCFDLVDGFMVAIICYIYFGVRCVGLINRLMLNSLD